MGDVVSSGDGVKADQAKPTYAAHPTPAVVVAIPLGLVAPVATLALSIIAGPVSFIVPAILVAGLPTWRALLL